jgi:dTDP-4-dehydrorhamnose 3,5-epimerase
MIFTETKLKGAYIIELEPILDERGFFARSFCQREFEKYGLNPCVAQCNISYNKKKGTLRGMHYQLSPFEEARLVRCQRGAIYDVIIDLRPDSATYCQWVAVELSADGVPLTAHGSQPTAYCSQLTASTSQLAAYCLPLTASNRMLYIPEGFAHGFLTLEDNTEVFYQMSEFYAPGYGQGIRWNDPAFGITWPEEINVISDQDKNYPDFRK